MEGKNERVMVTYGHNSGVQAVLCFPTLRCHVYGTYSVRICQGRLEVKAECHPFLHSGGICSRVNDIHGMWLANKLDTTRLELCSKHTYNAPYCQKNTI